MVWGFQGLTSPYNTAEYDALWRRGAAAGVGRTRVASAVSHQYVSLLVVHNKRSVRRRPNAVATAVEFPSAVGQGFGLSVSRRSFRSGLLFWRAVLRPLGRV
jgi:hypothetical protein